MNPETIRKNFQKQFPDVWVKPGNEFSSDCRAVIWSGEGSKMPDGTPAFDYDNPAYTFGVHPDLVKFATKYNCDWECEDPGTFMMYDW